MSACPVAPTDLGVMRDILAAVDCNARYYAMSGYQALSGPNSPLPAALTIVLTLYVATIGFRMLFALGGTRLSDAPLIAMEIGAVLALTLNWSAFQTLVFNLATDAPLQVARVISAPMAEAARGPGDLDLSRDPLTGLQTAYDELTADGQEFGRAAGPNALASRGGAAAAADGLWRAADALLASTVGVLGAAVIAVGVLTALGPVFIVLFIFESTRGFFVGWLRALAAVALAPMMCWITTSLMLVVIAPWIQTLTRQRLSHALSLDAATTVASIVLMFAAVQGVLVLAGLVVASGFSLARRAASAEAPALSSPAPAPAAPFEARARGEALSQSLRRISLVEGRESFGASAPALAATAADETAPAGSARPARLGESYRRAGVMRDRSRAGVAGRA